LRLTRLWKAVISTALAVVVITAPQTAANADSSGERQGSRTLAAFGGKLIDLKKDGWGTAQACVVYSRSEIRCFATVEESNRALGYNPATDPLILNAAKTGLAAAAPACASGWLCLYAAINGGGRRLIFRDEYWQSLYEYAFENQMSSWRNNQGSSDVGEYLLDDTTCGQCFWPMAARTYNSNVGSGLNDKADSIHG
jgi:Peptidase inhibitor family I36